MLGQAVDRLGEQIGAGMDAIPLLVDARVAQAEIGAQVDDAHAALAQLPDERRGLSMGIGDDGGLHLGVALEVELLELERHAVVRVELRERAARLGAGGDRAELE